MPVYTQEDVVGLFGEAEDDGYSEAHVDGVAVDAAGAGVVGQQADDTQSLAVEGGMLAADDLGVKHVAECIDHEPHHHASLHAILACRLRIDNMVGDKFHQRGIPAGKHGHLLGTGIDHPIVQ